MKSRIWKIYNTLQKKSEQQKVFAQIKSEMDPFFHIMLHFMEIE